MATKNEILTSINSIIDNGNNSAQKVRSVLIDLLNFTENPIPSTSETATALKSFSIVNSAGDIKKLSVLNYSFRGLVGLHVNFTFKFEFTGVGGTLLNVQPRFEYTLAKQDALLLSPLMKQNEKLPLNFMVPLRAKGDNGAFRSIRMGLSINSKGGLLMDFTNAAGNFNFGNGDTIYTSIHLHSPFAD